ncbi:nucleoside diphosphate kinase regulator [Streptomyces sp. CB01635]|uniref:GreA/GreB family elongation factor n=1 Tax=unclassified Streptomyces TaxID=2593676 RepID=UPI000C27B46A|nr:MULTISPECIES: GreA/GreB family elongation factor [unclassified Streptomyces]PJN11411.1 nucleoside diphosphate kinase regulator [Streptomyces sp. CB01635]
MSGEPEPMSATERRALEQELADVTAERDADAATLQDTTEVGDRADQADELIRSDETHRLDARIDEIKVRLRGAADAGRPSTDVVGVGSTLKVRYSDDSVATIQIGEGAAVLDRTLVTADSPLGSALLGHRAGDSVSYDAPDGQATVTVVSVGE